MVLLVLCLPLISAALVLIFGRWIGNAGAVLLVTLYSAISLFITSVLFYEVFIFDKPCYLELLDFLTLSSLSVSYVLHVDPTSVFMLLTVNIISFLVQLYSVFYMQEDPHKGRFFAYLSLFAFFMILLVISDNLIQLFFGWEGVGLCSYLLISFWFTRSQASTSAIKAFLINRVGDMFFILGLSVCSFTILSLDFIHLEHSVGSLAKIDINCCNNAFDLLTLLTLAFFIGAMSKSAQLFLHSWLPDAMEGPTPVSALIHAATMVAAGVFLLFKLTFLFAFVPDVANFVVFIGGSTAFFASVTGLYQNDIKKIIAYSTCSQLGYMFAGIGSGLYGIAFFHLLNHAFFKAMLFLASGSIIHSVLDNQDIRRLGSLQKILPITFMAFMVGTLAITGVPYFAGWYSKDPIIEMVYFLAPSTFNFISFEVTLGAFFTTAYSIRLLYFVFFAEFKHAKVIFLSIAREEFLISFVLISLISLSLSVGPFFSDFFLSRFSQYFVNSYSTTNNNFYLDFELLPYYIKFFTLFLLLYAISLVLPWLLLQFNEITKSTLRFSWAYVFLSKKWFFDLVQAFFFAFNAYRNAFSLGVLILEKSVFELIIPIFSQRVFITISRYIVSLQKGLLYNYLLLTVIAILTILIFLTCSTKLLLYIIICATMFILLGIFHQSFEMKVIHPLTQNQLAYVWAAYPWLPMFSVLAFFHTFGIYCFFFVKRHGYTPFLEWFV